MKKNGVVMKKVQTIEPVSEIMIGICYRPD